MFKKRKIIMKIGYFSDLHLEASNVVLDFSAYDCLIFAGDISADFFLLEQFLSYKVPHNIPVIFVPGNHEFYGSEMFTILEKLNHNFPNINIITGVEGFGLKSVEIGNVRFLGGTLWTDFALYAGSKRIPTVEDAISIGRNAINDFRRIS